MAHGVAAREGTGCHMGVCDVTWGVIVRMRHGYTGGWVGGRAGGVLGQVARTHYDDTTQP